MGVRRPGGEAIFVFIRVNSWFSKLLFVLFPQAAEFRQIVVGIFQLAQDAGERLVLARTGRIRIPIVAAEDFTRLFIMEINDFHRNAMLQRGLVSKNADGRHVNRLVHVDIDGTMAANRLRESPPQRNNS